MATTTTTRPMGPRALGSSPNFTPQQQQQYSPQVSHDSPTWYEAEQRMAPSYIQQRKQQSPQPQQAGYPFPTTHSNLPPGAALPYHFNHAKSNDSPQYRLPGAASASTQPPRANASRFQSYPAANIDMSGGGDSSDSRPMYAPGQSARHGGGTKKGSAFMHKGFFDIMQLANDRANAGAHLAPPNQNFDGAPPSPSKFRATLSKATTALRRNSNALNPAAVARALNGDQDVFTAPLPNFPQSPVAKSHAAAANAAAPTAGQLPGPRAAKKRISIDMVSAPKPDSFVHAAHASDAEQATEILNRWGRDGVGKIADPGWVLPIKEALRLQAARNQAEAIAQVQAAMHHESAFIHQQRPPLQVINGTPSSSTLTGNTISTTAGTLGHAAGSTPPEMAHGWAAPFDDIKEEQQRSGSGASQDGAFVSAVGQDAETATITPSPRLPPPSPARPVMMPRSNTSGTLLINPTPNAAPDGTEGPDYMAYRQVEATLANGPLDAKPNAAASVAIDGLPGSGPPGNINKIFDPPSVLRPARGVVPTAGRPTSMVVRDSPAAIAPSPAPLELSMPMAEAAGAALRPSLTTVEKSVAAKIYFENLYYGILKKPAARETRRAGLEKELAVLRIPDASKEAIRQAWIARETEHLRDMRARVCANAFVKLKTIGHGAFGVVALVREKHTGQLFAMKQLRKADMLRKGQEGHVRAERDLMTSASASGSRRWIVNLVYSFQDLDHLYLIMEFMGGGDLLNLLIEKDIFPEDFAKFYVAEMILAVHEAHRLGYIHRDIKPDNFLFTSEGHIKLADFGLCQSFHWAHDGAYYDQQRRNLLRKHGIDLDDAGAGAGAGRRSNTRQRIAGAQAPDAGGELNQQDLGEVMSDRNPDGTPLTHVLTWRDKNKKKIAYSVVGTNNYMAPEVLRGLGYDQSCDWWSLGVIVFEMLYGYPPFVSKSRHMTRQKILNWKQTLRFPPKPRVSREAQDFIARLVCEKDDRLGSTNLASVSRPNSVLQGARQQSGFRATGMAPSASQAGLVDGVDDLMSHPWFKGVDWSALHRSQTPFRPNLSHPADTKHFEDDIADEPLPAPGAPPPGANGEAPPAEVARDPMLRDKDHGQRLLEMRKQLAFVGYTFKRPPGFDPREINEADVEAAERAALETQSRLNGRIAGQANDGSSSNNAAPTASTITPSRIRAMSM